MMTGRDAVIAAPCGKGRVVAFGPHAELSPGLHHWLCSAVRWSAGEGPAEPSVQVTLERMRPGSASR
jgi:anti-sigma factor ChrR (cupin superfamily)